MKNMIVHGIHTTRVDRVLESQYTRHASVACPCAEYTVPGTPFTDCGPHDTFIERLCTSGVHYDTSDEPRHQKRNIWAATGSRHVRRGNKKPRAIGHLRGFPFCRRPALQWEALRWSVGGADAV